MDEMKEPETLSSLEQQWVLDHLPLTPEQKQTLISALVDHARSQKDKDV